MEKTVNITNFIGVYDGYIMDEECNRAIKIFEDEIQRLEDEEE